MTLDHIKHYFKHYDLPLPLSYKELPKTTSGNTSYIVKTNDTQYVIRLLVRQSVTSVKDEMTIQNLLNNAGIITPIYIKSQNGDTVEMICGTPAVVSELIPGERQPVDSIELAYNMAATIAKIHNTLSTTLLSFNEQQWFNPTNVMSQLEKYSGPDKVFIEKMTQAYAKVLSSNLPLATTHGDFHTNNVFSANNRVTAVFDFESAEYTVRILDIARLYLTYIKVTELTPNKVLDAITAGYNSTAETELTAEELVQLKNSFIYVALVSSVSIHNHGNKFSSGQYLEIAKRLIGS